MVKTYTEFLEDMLTAMRPEQICDEMHNEWCRRHCKEGKGELDRECLLFYYYKKEVEPELGDIIKETYERR